MFRGPGTYFTWRTFCSRSSRRVGSFDANEAEPLDLAGAPPRWFPNRAPVSLAAPGVGAAAGDPENIPLYSTQLQSAMTHESRINVTCRVFVAIVFLTPPAWLP